MVPDGQIGRNGGDVAEKQKHMFVSVFYMSRYSVIMQGNKDRQNLFFI